MDATLTQLLASLYELSRTVDSLQERNRELEAKLAVIETEALSVDRRPVEDAPCLLS